MLYSIIRSEQDTRTFLYPMSSNWFNSSSQSLTAEVIQLSGDQQVSGSPAISRLRRFYKEVTVLLLSWFCVSRESTHQLFFYVQHVGGFCFGQLPNILFPSSPLVFFWSNPGQQGTDLFWPFVRFVQVVSTSELCSFRFCFLGKHKRSEWDELLIRVRRFEGQLFFECQSFAKTRF